MNKICLALTLLVSAHVFAGETPAITPDIVVPEVNVNWLSKVNNAITTARVAVVKAMGQAWGALPTPVTNNTTAALNWTSDKVNRYTPSFVTSACNWVKTNTPETVKKFVSNPNVRFVVLTTAAALGTTYVGYKIASKIFGKSTTGKKQPKKETKKEDKKPALKKA